MANRNTKRLRAEKAKELAQKKKSDPTFRQSTPKRLSNPKDYSRWKQAPGYRKGGRTDEGAQNKSNVRVYKAEFAGV